MSKPLADDLELPAGTLLSEIRRFCEARGIAETTFGRLAANDGKLAARLAGGGRVSPETAERLRGFMRDVAGGVVDVRGRPRRKKSVAHAEAMAELVNRESGLRTAGSFAFHEQRQRYSIFAGTTDEAWVLADRIAADICTLDVRPPGIRLFFGAMDNGMAINRILRAVHRAFPNVPVLAVVKGRGLEDLHDSLGRLVDRLAEHPLTVFAMTNMYVREAVELRKLSDDSPHDTVWREVPLQGDFSHDFQTQTSRLYASLAGEWLVHQGAHGQPVYEKPSVLVLYREDRKFQLDGLIPKRGGPPPEFDHCLLHRPFLHSHTMRFRVDYVLAPVLRRLAEGGSATVVQSAGNDPAHEIVRQVWPDEKLPFVGREEIMRALRKSLGARAREFAFRGVTDTGSLFRFDMHTLPSARAHKLGVQSLGAAWSNAVYFAQVREELIQSAAAGRGVDPLDATRRAIERHGGLWFVDETLSIHRKPRGNPR